MIYVFGIMKPAEKGPSKADFISLEGTLAALTRRIQVIEDEIFSYKKAVKAEQEAAIKEVEEQAEADVKSAQMTAAVNTRWSKQREQDGELAAALADLKTLTDQKVPTGDALKQVMAQHPGLVAQLMRKYLKF